MLKRNISLIKNKIYKSNITYEVMNNMRKRDYILATSSLNRIINSTLYYDTEHADIILEDGGSLKKFIENLNNPQEPEEPGEETPSIADKAIVDKTKSI